MFHPTRDTKLHLGEWKKKNKREKTYHFGGREQGGTDRKPVRFKFEVEARKPAGREKGGREKLKFAK